MDSKIAADFGIRQLHARYVDALWRKDVDSFLDCFSVDAEWLIAGRHLRGRPQIGEALVQLMEPSERVLMIASPPLLTFRDDDVQGIVYITELVKRSDGDGHRTIGRYQDVYESDAAQWRFARRELELAYSGPPDLSGEFRSEGG